MSEFKLSASLVGHEDDVRGVAFPHPKTILSASRDATVRTWKLLSPSPPTYDASIASHGTAFINSITFVPPSSNYPQGLIVSGGKDTIIEVRELGKSPDEHAERLLTGHAHNVCTLDVSPDGTWIVSGSWDGSARVWSVGKWQCDAVLEGHQASVWCVLAYDKDTIITACADKLIRVFTTSGKLLQTIRGNTDVVRALCKLPNGHPSGADFASAGNDGTIRLWELRGRQVGELLGHESFIYSLASLANGDIVSAGEDRTVRIWKNNECIQTITHPAISVWSVAVCAENGDIVSGTSDRLVRVFTRNQDRQADPDTIKSFEEAVKGSSIPQQQVGEVNKEKLPGPEFLTQKSGTKEGQVAMIKEANGSVTAHTWSMAAQQWVNVGTVVDAEASSGKKTDYLGKDYDYVFDVDIEDGKPPLKLPYNLSQNPYEAATKFIQDNELPMTYLDQVANFITTNTQGATIGQSSQPSVPSGADPWGMEQRYRPGEVAPSNAQPQVPTPSSQSKILPQTQCLSIKTANLKVIQKKIEELNEQLISSGSKEHALNPDQISMLQRLTTTLEATTSTLSASDATAAAATETLSNIILNWPLANLLPALDLLRILTASSPAPALAKPSLVNILSRSGVCEDTDRPNNIMLAVRALANLFQTAQGIALVDTQFEYIQALAQPVAKTFINRNISIALATTYINCAVFLTSASQKDLPSSIDRSFSILNDLEALLGTPNGDSEVVYRALVALGTLLTLGEETRSAAKEVYGAGELLRTVMAGGKREPRIVKVVAEIEKVLEER